MRDRGFAYVAGAGTGIVVTAAAALVVALTSGGSSVPAGSTPPATPTVAMTTSPSPRLAEPATTDPTGGPTPAVTSLADPTGGPTPAGSTGGPTPAGTSPAPTTGAPAQTPQPTSAPGNGGPTACPGCWRPPVRTSWNWVLARVPKPPFQDVDIYDIDGFDASAADVAALHNAGIRVICYISVGSYENWRADAGQFPAGILGRDLDGWPGERWLDIRDIRNPGSALARIMAARIDMCRRKGFDAVEFDNMDGYSNRTGFPLTAADQLAYNRFLANTAHAAGLSAVMKNDVGQIRDLVDYFELALNEECSRYNECGAYQAFIAAGKPVLHAEYGSSTAFCAADNAANRNGVLLSRALDGSVYQPCR